MVVPQNVDALKKECIAIVLQKFFKEEQTLKLAELLHKKDAISKSCHDKVCKGLKSKEKSNEEKIEKIVNSLEQLKFVNFEYALCVEEFPADQETKELLLSIHKSQTPHLFILIKNWNLLAQPECFSEFRDILGLQLSGSSEDDVIKVRKMIILALEKLHQPDEEGKKVVEAAMDFIGEKSEFIKSLASDVHTDDQSQQKTKGNSDDIKNSERSESQSLEGKNYLRPMSSSILGQNTELSIEFRALVADTNALPTNTILHIRLEGYGWKPIPMDFNERKGYFTYRCICDTSFNELLKYKFCFPNNGEDHSYLKHERLPYDNFGYTNREVSLRKVETQQMIIISICLFDHSGSWERRCCEAMEKVLPPLGVSDNETSAAVDIFLWMNCVKGGWYINRINYKAPENVFEKILVKWLRDTKEKMSSNIKDVLDQLSATLSLVVSIAYEEHRICSSELLSLLFQMLRIDQLKSDKDCKKLYSYAMKQYEQSENLGIRLPTFREAIDWLYKQIPSKPNMEWILSLPLYWLMIHGGDSKKEVQLRKPIKSILYSQASLPRINDLDWNKVWQRCRTCSHERQVFSYILII
uniref:uncharacterized protein LOC120328592 n=1 Tax=Styela clava TaxID=7725 RepID=UPI001939F7F9|nr:uncharacterized protein LOC120328592 [Styela clava]